MMLERTSTGSSFGSFEVVIAYVFDESLVDLF